MQNLVCFGTEKRAAERSAALWVLALAKELAGVVQVDQNFLNVILKLFVHSK